MQNKEEEHEVERRRFTQKLERKGNEHEREKNEWNEMYQVLQREIVALKQQVQEKENQLLSTLRRSNEGGLGGMGSFKSSMQQSPSQNKLIYVEGGGSSNQVYELQE